MKTLWRKLFVYSVLTVCLCSCEKLKPYIPSPTIPTNVVPVIPTPAPDVNKDTNKWGAVLSVPQEDLASGEWRWGSDPQTGILEVHADYWLGRWASKGVSRRDLQNGDVEFTMVPMQGPSGRWYKPYAWRVAHEASPLIYTNVVTCPKNKRGDVMRARFECREKPQ